MIWIVFTKVYMRDLCEPILSFTRDNIAQVVLSGRVKSWYEEVGKEEERYE